MSTSLVSPTDDGYVYFIEANQCEKIKIGFSLDPLTRLEELQSLSPDDLSLAGCFPGTKQTEQEIHRQFARFRSHGEWFQAHTDLSDFIDLPTIQVAYCEYLIDYFDDDLVTEELGAEIDALFAKALVRQ